MRISPKLHILLLIGIASAAIIIQSCAFIAGEEQDALARPGLDIRFVESLRNQQSLRGESYREVVNATPPASLQRPGSVYADQYRVYVTDTTLPVRVFIFNRAERTVTQLGIPAPPSGAEGKLLAPSGIAVDGSFRIFVSDAQQGRVFGYDLNGRLQMVLGRPEAIASRTAITDLSSPSAIAINNANNRIYIADSAGHRVRVFSTAGIHLFDIEKSGRRGEDFRFPTGIALDPAGNVYVVDSLRRSLYQYTADGVFLRSFSLKSADVPGDAIKPSGVALDSHGHIYVPDAINNFILIFNSDGSFLTKWGTNGKLFGDFWTPAGIFIDNNDYIYVADQTNSRIQIFQYVK